MDVSRALQHCITHQGNDKQTRSLKSAQCVVNSLVDTLNTGKELSGPMKKAFEQATAAVQRFVKEHPVLVKVTVTLVALGILAVLIPWAIEALGFGRFGPVKGTFPIIFFFVKDMVIMS